MPDDELPNISRDWDLPDDDRAYELARQASLPAELVNPADALGDDEWKRRVDEDVLGMGENAAIDFGYEWNWEMTPGQRASALADVALRREVASFVDEASSLVAKPPVDPMEFAAKTRERRAERARRI